LLQPLQNTYHLLWDVYLYYNALLFPLQCSATPK
jgi:hypothetical protein